MGTLAYGGEDGAINYWTVRTGAQGRPREIREDEMVTVETTSR